jgi:hypothetical protein
VRFETTGGGGGGGGGCGCYGQFHYNILAITWKDLKKVGHSWIATN